ncbi:hypothetical protein ACFL35_08605 [Candidatus Riflebacteria bacterium]
MKFKFRDLKFLGSLLITIYLIIIFISAELQIQPEQTGGYRKIDFALVQKLIEKGELSGKEASFYKRVSEQ